LQLLTLVYSDLQGLSSSLFSSPALLRAQPQVQLQRRRRLSCPSWPLLLVLVLPLPLELLLRVGEQFVAEEAVMRNV
jgi:hypothetical protein